MFRVMLSVELLMSNTSNTTIVVSKSREIFNQVQVQISGCHDGKVENHIVNQMTEQLGAKRWRDNMTDNESR